MRRSRWLELAAAAALPLLGLPALAAAGWLIWARGPRPGQGVEGLRALPGAPPAPVAAPMGEAALLRVLSFNIAYGRGPEDDAGDLRTRGEVEGWLAQIAEQIRATGADIALLQEVDLDARRTHHIDQVAWLAEATSLRHSATAITWSKRYVPYPSWPPRGHYGPMLSGQAVLSRFPILEQQAVPLPQPAANPFWYNWFYLQRTYQQVRLDLGGGRRLTAVNLHLEAFDRPNREEQARLVAALLQQAPGPLVAGGDLNCVPPEAPLRRGFPDEPETDMDGEATIPLLRGARPGLQDVFPAELYAGAGGQATLTFPAGQPNRKLDYLFVDHAGLLLQQAEVPAARPACSDHRPVLAVLRLVE